MRPPELHQHQHQHLSLRLRPNPRVALSHDTTSETLTEHSGGKGRVKMVILPPSTQRRPSSDKSATHGDRIKPATRRPLYPSMAATTEEDITLARANAPADASQVGSLASDVESVAEVRPPRPANRALLPGEGSIKEWETPWNQQSPPPPPSLPDIQQDTAADLSLLFPPDFPRFQSIQNLNDFGAYLANASYIVSVGGSPLADIKYGIILVPAGEERLLFGQQPDGEASTRLHEALRHPRSAYIALHDIHKDSPEFLRRRNVPRDRNTESAAASVYSAGNGRRATGKPAHGDGDGGVAMLEAGPLIPGEEPSPTATKKGKKQAAASRNTAAKPQGVVKKKAPPKKPARTGTETPVSTTARTRTLRPREIKK